MQGTFLGKIESIKFGLFDHSKLGLIVDFKFNTCCGISDITNLIWDPESIKVDKYTRWTEDDRDRALAEIMRYISKLLSEAKVDDITKLAGKPIELVINEHNSLESWRILTEVL